MDAQSAPNFQSSFDDTTDHVERPKPLPVGTYLCIVGAPRYDRSSKKGTPFVEFLLRPLDADEDVDPEDLEAAGGLDGKTIRATYYDTPDAIYRLDEFHVHCGLDLGDPASRRTRNDMVVNAQVLAYVKHRTPEGSDQAFAELQRTLPAAD